MYFFPFPALYNGEVEVAVKTLKAGTMSTDAFMEEAKIMKKFKHPNIVSLYAVCSVDEPILIVTEYMRYGALLDFLRNGEGRRMVYDQLIAIAAQVNKNGCCHTFS